MKVFVEKAGYWCGSVASENGYYFGDGSIGQINLLHTLCLCKGFFILASQGVMSRSIHLFPLLFRHCKQNTLKSMVLPCPQVLWLNTQRITTPSPPPPNPNPHTHTHTLISQWTQCLCCITTESSLCLARLVSEPWVVLLVSPFWGPSYSCEVSACPPHTDRISPSSRRLGGFKKIYLF